MEDMMVTIGIAFAVFWALLEVFALAMVKAAIVTAAVFILLGLLIEGIPNYTRKP